MRHVLYCHPASRPPAVGIAVHVERFRDGDLLLHYSLNGAEGCLIPPLGPPPVRADGLWRHTCFEAFLGVEGEAAYCEFNFSPSRAWAAYRFDAYRAGMRPAQIEAPQIALHQGVDGLELRACVRLAGVVPADAPWRLGLAAVIESTDGAPSYWALRHPPGKPDFHHPDCFALELAPISPS